MTEQRIAEAWPKADDIIGRPAAHSGEPTLPC
jgi:hypothetical protein